MARTPKQMCDDFDLAILGRSDIDPHEILHEIIADIVDSMRLAIMNTEPNEMLVLRDRLNIIATVEDYITNHYAT